MNRTARPSVPRRGDNHALRPVRLDGTLAYVPLTRGMEAVIDAADVWLVERWNWTATAGEGRIYAARYTALHGKKFPVFMHRAIVWAPQGRDVDHRDLDGLNNRRSNLRLCTGQQNSWNTRALSRNRTGFKGVWEREGKFLACLKVDGRTLHLGTFDTPEEAHATYVEYADKHFGEFSRAA